MYPLITEVLRALEEPSSRLGALGLTSFLVAKCWAGIAEYRERLLSNLLPIMVEDGSVVVALL